MPPPGQGFTTDSTILRNLPREYVGSARESVPWQPSIEQEPSMIGSISHSASTKRTFERFN